MTEMAVLVCSICNEPSADICVCCTKDACRNHRCERCKRCSDCCECDVPLTVSEHVPESNAPEIALPETSVEITDLLLDLPHPEEELYPDPPRRNVWGGSTEVEPPFNLHDDLLAEAPDEDESGTA